MSFYLLNIKIHSALSTKDGFLFFFFKVQDTGGLCSLYFCYNCMYWVTFGLLWQMDGWEALVPTC